MVARPFISIIIPVYNREKEIRRCLDSVIQQDGSEYEIIAIDDASDDHSWEVIATYPTVKLLRNSRNVGVVATRHSGVRHAAGDWVLFLDSDDELVDNALAVVHQRLCDLPGDIAVAMFCCKMDDGSVSPDPMPPCGAFGYKDYVEYMGNVTGKHESLYCVRVNAIRSLLLPTISGLEDLPNFELHRLYKARFFPDVVRFYHQDADNQLVKRLLSNLLDDLHFSQARAEGLEHFLSMHGAAMKEYAPRLYFQQVSRLATLEFCIGRRRKGLSYSVSALTADPLHLRSWLVPLFGMCGPKAITLLRDWHIKLMGRIR